MKYLYRSPKTTDTNKTLELLDGLLKNPNDSVILNGVTFGPLDRLPVEHYKTEGFDASCYFIVRDSRVKYSVLKIHIVQRFREDKLCMKKDSERLNEFLVKFK